MISVPENQAIIIAVVEPDFELRHRILEALGSIQLTAEAFASADVFLQQYQPGKTSCAIVAMRMPGHSGLDLLRRLRDNHDHLNVILISEYGDSDSILEAFRLGATDFIAKPFSDQLLLDRIIALHDAWLTQRQFQAAREQALMKLDQLTPRERQVIALLAAGLATKQIAVRLGLQQKTIENRRRIIRDKLQIGSLAELVAFVVPLLNPVHCAEQSTGILPCGLAASDARPCGLQRPSATARPCPLDMTNLQTLLLPHSTAPLRKLPYAA